MFAEVFLDQDFLNEFELTPNDAATEGLIKNVLSKSLNVAAGDDSVTGGIQNADTVYPYSDNPADYVDGVVPAGATDADKLALSAPAGTQTALFGAFAPQVVYGPANPTGTIMVAGTNMGDILSVNEKGFAPSKATSSGALASSPSTVLAFDGDDIVFGGNGVDEIHGGDGNDTIYGIGHEGVETVETFTGDAGDDLIYLGWTSMSAIADGGDGNDTVSFRYVDGKVKAELYTITTDPLNNPNATSTNKADSFISRYALANFENLEGSNNADTLTGNAGANVLSGLGGDDALTGAAGADTISGGDGYDTVRFASERLGCCGQRGSRRWILAGCLWRPGYRRSGERRGLRWHPRTTTNLRETSATAPLRSIALISKAWVATIRWSAAGSGRRSTAATTMT